MQADYLALLVILTVINYVFVLFIDRYLSTHPTRRVYDVTASTEQRIRERHNSIFTTPVHALLLGAFLVFHLLRPGSDTFTSIIITFAISFVWTEIWHYISHVAMHTRVLHFIHREHHRSRITNPWSSVSFSFFEKLIFSFGIIGCMSILSHFIDISVYGIMIYYILYFLTNTLGHANIEIRKPGYSRTFSGNIFNTPAYHAMHHARYVKNYGLITPLMDKLFATYWDDAAKVQDRAARGRPLHSLNEKC